MHLIKYVQTNESEILTAYKRETRPVLLYVVRLFLTSTLVAAVNHGGGSMAVRGLALLP